MVSSLVFACGALAIAGTAGLSHENGTGAMWIAPEIVALETAESAVSTCAVRQDPRPAELRFETIEVEPGALPDLLIEHARDVVDFEWNPATSELSFRTRTDGGIFRDLALSAPRATGIGPSCGSR